MTGVRTFVFLRAINVGGRRLTNDELTAPLIEAGCRDVAAYQAAGNLTFVADDTASVDETRLDHIFAGAFGFDAPVFARSALELRAIVEQQPFSDAEIAQTEGRIQVTLLRRSPTDGDRAAVAALVPEEDLVVVDDRVWYWLPSTGVSASALPVAGIERILGPMTMRTLGTITRMLTRFTD